MGKFNLDTLNDFSDKLDGVYTSEIKKQESEKNEIKGTKVKILGINPLIVVSISVVLIIGLTIATLVVKTKK